MCKNVINHHLDFSLIIEDIITDLTLTRNMAIHLVTQYMVIFQPDTG